MVIVRNVQIKLDVPEDAHRVLDETFEEFREAAQHVRDGDEFECLKCGKELHSDYNAARNIGWRLVQN